VSADGEYDFAGSRRRSGSEQGSGDSIDAENRDVCVGVTADQLGRGSIAVGEGDRDIVIAADGVFGGDDEAWLPQEAARTDAMAGLDGDGGLAGLLDQAGEVCREVVEEVFHASMMIDAGAPAHHPNGQSATRYFGQVRIFAIAMANRARRCCRRSEYQENDLPVGTVDPADTPKANYLA
jgi:hypothetical protein